MANAFDYKSIQGEPLNLEGLVDTGYTEADLNNMGDFSRGIRQGTQEAIGTLYGAGGLAAGVVGATSARDAALKAAADKFQQSQALGLKHDQILEVGGLGDAVDYAQHGLGYLVPSVATAVLGGGIGGAIGKKLVAKGVEKAIARTAMERGAIAGAGGASFIQEAGSIYPEAIEEGTKNAEGRAVAGGLAATALDLIPQVHAAKKLGLLKGKGAQMAEAAMEPAAAKTATTGIKRVGKEAGKQAGEEAATEGAQTFIERLSAGQDTTSKEAVHDYIESAALGALGGGTLGAGVGLRSPNVPVEPPKPSLSGAIKQLEFKSTPVAYTDSFGGVTIKDVANTDLASAADATRFADNGLTPDVIAAQHARNNPDGRPYVAGLLPSPEMANVYDVDPQGNVVGHRKVVADKGPNTAERAQNLGSTPDVEAAQAKREAAQAPEAQLQAARDTVTEIRAQAAQRQKALSTLSVKATPDDIKAAGIKQHQYAGLTAPELRAKADRVKTLEDKTKITKLALELESREKSTRAGFTRELLDLGTAHNQALARVQSLQGASTAPIRPAGTETARPAPAAPVQATKVAPAPTAAEPKAKSELPPAPAHIAKELSDKVPLMKDFDAQAVATRKAMGVAEDYKGTTVVDDYHETSHEVNTALRSGKLGKNEQQFVKEMDASFKHTLPRATVIYRGLDQKTFGSIKVGSEFSDKAYMSGSSTPAMATYFGAKEIDEPIGGVLRIEVPKGHPAIVGNADEKEVILPRGTKLQVTGIVKHTSKSGSSVNVITAKVVPAKAAPVKSQLSEKLQAAGAKIKATTTAPETKAKPAETKPKQAEKKTKTEAKKEKNAEKATARKEAVKAKVEEKKAPAEPKGRPSMSVDKNPDMVPPEVKGKPEENWDEKVSAMSDAELKANIRNHPELEVSSYMTDGKFDALAAAEDLISKGPFKPTRQTPVTKGEARRAQKKNDKLDSTAKPGVLAEATKEIRDNILKTVKKWTGRENVKFVQGFETAAAQYDIAWDTVIVSLNDIDNTYLFHESMHRLIEQGIIPEKTLRAMRKQLGIEGWSRDGAGNQAPVGNQMYDYLVQWMKDTGRSKTVESQQKWFGNDEVIAYASELWMSLGEHAPQKGGVAKFIDRLKAMLAEVRNYILGTDYKSLDEFFSAVNYGKYAARGAAMADTSAYQAVLNSGKAKTAYDNFMRDIGREGIQLREELDNILISGVYNPREDVIRGKLREIQGRKANVRALNARSRVLDSDKKRNPDGSHEVWSNVYNGVTGEYRYRVDHYNAKDEHVKTEYKDVKDVEMLVGKLNSDKRRLTDGSHEVTTSVYNGATGEYRYKVDTYNAKDEHVKTEYKDIKQIDRLLDSEKKSDKPDNRFAKLREALKNKAPGEAKSENLPVPVKGGAANVSRRDFIQKVSAALGQNSPLGKAGKLIAAQVVKAGVKAAAKVGALKPAHMVDLHQVFYDDSTIDLRELDDIMDIKPLIASLKKKYPHLTDSKGANAGDKFLDWNSKAKMPKAVENEVLEYAKDHGGAPFYSGHIQDMVDEWIREEDVFDEEGTVREVLMGDIREMEFKIDPKMTADEAYEAINDQIDKQLTTVDWKALRREHGTSSQQEWGEPSDKLDAVRRGQNWTAATLGADALNIYNKIRGESIDTKEKLSYFGSTGDRVRHMAANIPGLRRVTKLINENMGLNTVLHMRDANPHIKPLAEHVRNLMKFESIKNEWRSEADKVSTEMMTMPEKERQAMAGLLLNETVSEEFADPKELSKLSEGARELYAKVHSLFKSFAEQLRTAALDRVSRQFEGLTEDSDKKKAVATAMKDIDTKWKDPAAVRAKEEGDKIRAIQNNPTVPNKDLAIVRYKARSAKKWAQPVDLMIKGEKAKRTAFIEANFKSQAEAKAKSIEEITKNFDQMLKKPYFPLSRFGEYTLEYTDKEGDAVFQLFESSAEREAAIKLAKAEGAKDIQSSMLDKEIYDSGLTMLPVSMIRNMAADLGLSAKTLGRVQQILFKMSNPQSFMKHYIHRKNVEGYTQDMVRTFANYFNVGSSFMARARMSDTLQGDIEKIRASKTEGDTTILTEIANTLTSRLQNTMRPGEEWGSVKQAGFLISLAAVPKAALVNFTGLAMIGLPFLSAHYGGIKASRAMMSALRDIDWKAAWSGKKVDVKGISPELREAMDRAEKSGIISQSMISELGSLSSGSKWHFKQIAGVPIGRILNGMGAMFSKVEEVNRHVMFAAVFNMEIAKGSNKAQAEEAAVMAVQKTMFEYSRWNRPDILRGGIKGTVFQFKNFTIQYMKLMLAPLGKGGDPKDRLASIYMMSSLFVAAGLLGMPGAEDLLDVLDSLLSSENVKFDSRAKGRKVLADLVGSGAADVLMHGMTRSTPFDLSGSLSAGRVIPALEAVFSKNKETVEDFYAALGTGLGPVVNWGANVLAAIASDNPDVWKRTDRALPNFLKHPAEAVRWATRDKETDTAGRTVKQGFNPLELGGKILGFQPTDLSQKRELVWELTRKDKEFMQRRTVLLNQMGYALLNGGKGAPEAITKIGQFNRDVAESGNYEYAVDGQSLTRSMLNHVKKQNMIVPKRQMPQLAQRIAELE